MNKHILPTTLALGLCLGLMLPTAAAGQTFRDVPSTHWASQPIGTMAAKGIVTGIGDGRFAPGDPVSTAQFCVMVGKLFYADELSRWDGGSYTWWDKYADVLMDAGALDQTTALAYYEKGIWDEDIMNAPMSRYDMAQIMYDVLKSKGLDLPDSAKIQTAASKLADFSAVPEQYRDAVLSMYAMGCLSGTGKGTFDGTGSMDRASACAVLCRLTDTVGGSSSAPAPTTPAAPDEAFTAEVLRLVNEARAAEGLSALTTRDDLTAVAQLRAEELTEHYSHTRPDGTSCFTALDEAGISCRTFGENIAAGYTTPAAVVDGWMNSPGHYANIMNASFRYLGVGYAYDADCTYGHYWSQVFLG
ncbi:CAP domain-containing protein [Pseudoflavonifractor sp. MSJ-37]|uniref:CAP and S-layer homology domain-containing protein n=1 Tax=Pseudoflavonifractor sp. MSJ-37 TaxID=2841531 RepID=UPI001C11BE80|nr:CAP domain-containing protein [Pseudoflavonifractor sp. MSJ-37]MBU5435328.1 S-layer homology domain-containing protein [Pseudoflavonifractor sp. MSJ-37]